jgi:hypothetical protein
MAFKLFKKQKDSNNDLPDVPGLDLPEPPNLDNNDNTFNIPRVPNQEKLNVPEPPKFSDSNNDLPEVPELAEKEDNIPNFDVPKPEPKKSIAPRFKQKDEDLPDFPDSGMIKDQDVPEPPAFLSKMDDVKKDMHEGYMEQGTSIIKLNRPIFIEVNDYKKVLRTIKSIERDSKKSKKIAEELEEIKNKREKHLQGWDKKLENIQRSLIFADKILFEEGGVNV